MKLFFIQIIAGIFVCTQVPAQQKNVNFQSIDLDEALQKAKVEKKTVFMDCYTSWCGPCKAMARDVFTVDSIADYFNETFVCVKYDMEKEGKELAKKYPLNCYPTFLILDADGKELHRLSGYYAPDKLIRAIRMATPENTQEQLEIRFKSGERSPEFIETYLTVLKGLGELEQIDDILSGLVLYQSEKDIDNPVLWRILQEYQNNTRTPDARFLLDHLPLFRKTMGKEAVDDLLDKLYSIEVTNYLFWEQKFPKQSFDIGKLDQFIKELQQLEFEEQEVTLVFALTEKMYREKKIDEAIRYIRTARELCILPKAYQLRYFSVYADKLLSSADKLEEWVMLREECDQMLKYVPGDLMLLMKKYGICYKLKDKENLDRLRTELNKAGYKAGFKIVYGRNGQISTEKL